MTRRLPDWPARLQAVVARAHAQPFAWGVHDCCLWAADVVHALTGADHAATVRGSYCDAIGAARLMRRLGGLRGIGSAAGPRIAPALAIEGDIGLVRGARKPMLAAMLGGVWMVVASEGLHAIDRDRAVMAWGVGHG